MVDGLNNELRDEELTSNLLWMGASGSLGSIEINEMLILISPRYEPTIIVFFLLIFM